MPKSNSITLIKTRLNISDMMGSILVRFGFNRAKYRVPPGLYAAGKPDQSSPVLVTANYKLTFDILRRELDGINAWILVVDTRGINVWCAAGKGTFSTEEVVNRIQTSKLGEVVDHRTVILPQLAAPGVAAHEVRERCGFRVKYGPVKAKDISAYLKSGMKATEEMRHIHFPFTERVKLVPMEFTYALKGLVPSLLVLTLLTFLAHGHMAWTALAWLLIPIVGAFLVGSVIVPAFLPWIPFRSFVIKGITIGIVWALFISAIHDGGWFWRLGNIFLLPAITAFYALNFTGSTTYTSQSGVNKEIRIYARPLGISALCGLVFTVLSIFVQ
jgi:hypothetical protein